MDNEHNRMTYCSLKLYKLWQCTVDLNYNSMGLHGLPMEVYGGTMGILIPLWQTHGLPMDHGYPDSPMTIPWVCMVSPWRDHGYPDSPMTNPWVSMVLPRV